MAKRSAIDTLPEDIRRALERRLSENGFANYTELTDWLNAQGYEVSRSAVHRYGQKVERRFASIKASTEAARLIAEGAADEGDAVRFFGADRRNQRRRAVAGCPFRFDERRRKAYRRTGIGQHPPERISGESKSQSGRSGRRRGQAGEKRRPLR